MISVFKLKKNKATINTKVTTSVKQSRSTYNYIYTTDDKFFRKSSIVILHPNKRTHWVCYVANFQLDSYRCAPLKNISNYLKKIWKICSF